MAKSYAEKLRDPRWQRRRLEVLEAAGWACEKCDDRTSTLHVHHPVYLKRRDPWDCPGLMCLCESCHAWAEQARERIQLAAFSLGAGYLAQILGFSEALTGRCEGEPETDGEAIGRVAADSHLGVEIADEAVRRWPLLFGDEDVQ